MKHIAVFGRHSNFESEPTDNEIDEARQLLKNLPTVVVMTPLEFNLDYYVEAFKEKDVQIFGWTNKNHPRAKDQIFLNSIYVNEYGTAAHTVAILVITLMHETVHWAVGKLKGTSPTHPFDKDRLESGYYFENRFIGGIIAAQGRLVTKTEGRYIGHEIYECSSVHLAQGNRRYPLTPTWYREIFPQNP